MCDFINGRSILLNQHCLNNDCLAKLLWLRGEKIFLAKLLVNFSNDGLYYSVLAEQQVTLLYRKHNDE